MYHWIFIAILYYLAVGCDGIVGSRAILDQCGVCNGDNKSCRVIAGIFTRVYLPRGYNLITRIPAGACKINITEMAYSRNYLALKITNGSYSINGYRHISRHGNYRSAGTTFTYSRGNRNSGCPGSCLFAEGPTTESIDIELLFYGRNNGIKYQFNIPVNLTEYFMRNMWPKTSYSQFYNNRTTNQNSGNYRKTNQNNRRNLNVGQTPYYVPPPTNDRRVQSFSANRRNQNRRYRYGSQYYNNQYYRTNPRNRNNYGQNRAAQGDYGVRYNSYQATNNRIANTARTGHHYSPQTGNNVYNGRRPYVNDAINPLRSPPLSAQAVPDRVNFYWRISGFTDCSVTCGGGVQMTKVICMKRNSNIVVTQENCDLRDKPNTQTITCNTKPCPPSWTSGNWTDCSVTCGAGMQTREVTCQQRVTDQVSMTVPIYRCVYSERPESSRSCKSIPCADWKIGDWGKCSAGCGKGEKRRQVICQNVNNVTVSDGECYGIKPESSQICDMGSCAQGWFHSRWSEFCSSSCGKGYYTRTVYCSAPDGTELSESKCSNSKPREKKACQNAEPCGGYWFEGPWTECSATCGTGVRKRDVICMKKLGRSLFAVVSEENCEGKPKPKSEESCDKLPACTSEWFMTVWSPCSKSCGTGTKTREVKCLDANLEPSTSCDLTRRPSRRHICNTHSCEQPQLDEDPGCKDALKLCYIAVQARLCKTPYYEIKCCESCKKHELHQRHRRKRRHRRRQ